MAATILENESAMRSEVESGVPLGVLVIAILTPLLDLIFVLQHAASTAGLATLTCGLGAVLFALIVLRNMGPVWLLATTLAFAASFVLRLAGPEQAIAFSLLGLLALGLGGAFSSRGCPPLLDVSSLAGASAGLDLVPEIGGQTETGSTSI